MGNLDTLVPTPDDLAKWENVNSDDMGAPVELIQLYLQLATDLLVIATEITEAPAPDTAIGRLVKAGILDMAWYISETKESQNEIFSPFSGEHIGSYSYNKMAKAVMQGDETGVNFFDLAVKYLTEDATYAQGYGIGGGSENVFWKPQSATSAQFAYDRNVDLILRGRFGVTL